MEHKSKIEVEIWSDLMCPFCYIGKRKFETALAIFEHKQDVEVVWKSFQLSPDLVTQPHKNNYQFLAEHKGISIEEAKGMADYVTEVAKKVGLVYNFETAVVANSFKAHRFLHFTKIYGNQNEAEELLFKAYFTDGQNTDDTIVLLEIGKTLGLDIIMLKNALETNAFAEEVKADIQEAQQVGVRGVPFFVFNRKFAVSGAQESDVFLQTLQKSYQQSLL